MNDALKEALETLAAIECHCDEAYTRRGRHESNSFHFDFKNELEVIRAALESPEPVVDVSDERDRAWHDGYQAARAAARDERTHEWRDDDICLICNHAGQHHYCEKEELNGTHDDDWCSACQQDGSQAHEFLIAITNHEPTPEEVERALKAWNGEITRLEHDGTSAEVASYAAMTAAIKALRSTEEV